MLIFSGWRYEFPPGSDKYDPDFIEAVERFDSETNSMAGLQRSANKEIDLYPRMHLMPNGRLFRAGPEDDTQYFDPATARWADSAVMNFGYRSHGSSVLLPGLTEVLALGGPNIMERRRLPRSSTSVRQDHRGGQPSP